MQKLKGIVFIVGGFLFLAGILMVAYMLRGRRDRGVESGLQQLGESQQRAEEGNQQLENAIGSGRESIRNLEAGNAKAEELIRRGKELLSRGKKTTDN